MKKITFLFALIPFFFLSCAEKTYLSGIYQADYLVKNGFSETENNENPDVILNVQEKISYDFSESGKYTKNVEQKLNSVDNLKNIALPLDENEIAKNIDNKLTILGTYSVRNDTIHFSAYEIILSDGTYFDYDDYHDLNNFINESETDEDFEFENDSIKIGEIKYKKQQ